MSGRKLQDTFAGMPSILYSCKFSAKGVRLIVGEFVTENPRNDIMLVENVYQNTKSYAWHWLSGMPKLPPGGMYVAIIEKVQCS